MSIDERLEKLVGRHEALTERHQALSQSVELLTMDIRSLAAENKVTGALVREVIAGIEGLVKIVRNHEQRLSDLEG